MPVSRNVLSALAAAAAVGKVHAAFGSAFSTGPTSDDTFIIESWATLNLPAVPTDNAGDLSLWVGMGTSNGDLIQSIAENYDTSDWSLYAYTLVSTSDTTQEPIQAEGTTGAAGSAVTFHYYYDAATSNYTQDVIVAGSVVSTLSTSDGEAQGWGSAVECAAEDCGTVGAHTWTNVSITLSGAYAGYINTLGLGQGVEATMTTPDDGITWEVGTISIPGYDFTTASVTDDVAATPSSSSSSSSASSGVSTSSNNATPSGSSTSSGSDASSGASGAVPSGTATTGSQSQSSGAPTWGSAGSQSSGGWGHHGHHGNFAGWGRSRIARGRN